MRIATIPDSVLLELGDIYEKICDERVKCTPTESFTEFEHLRDQLETIAELMEDTEERLRMILQQETMHRRTVIKPAIRPQDPLPNPIEDGYGWTIEIPTP